LGLIFLDVVPGEYLDETWSNAPSTRRKRPLYVMRAEPSGNAVLIDIYDLGIYAVATAFYGA